MNDEHDTVIHLAFRGDGTVERIKPPKAPPPEPEDAPAEPPVPGWDSTH